jgi:hypothetical protein
MITSISCLLPVAPLPTLDKVISCGRPEIPTADQVLDKLDVNSGVKAKLVEPLNWLLKAVECDRVLFIDPANEYGCR